MRSLLEEEVNAWLLHFYVGEVRHNVKDILSEGKEIDLYLPSLKLGIEVNGDLWHSDAAIDYTYGMSAEEYHLEKFQEADSMGIHLYFLWELDWLIDRERVESEMMSLLRGTHVESTLVGPRNTHFSLDDVLDAEEGGMEFVINYQPLPELSNEALGLLKDRVEPILNTGKWTFSIKDSAIDEMVLKKVVIPMRGRLSINPLYVLTRAAWERL